MNTKATPRTSTSCPICRRTSHAPFTPFCSRRCADVDLGRWLRGDYAVPGEPVDDPEPDEGERT